MLLTRLHETPGHRQEKGAISSRRFNCEVRGKVSCGIIAGEVEDEFNYPSLCIDNAILPLTLQALKEHKLFHCRTFHDHLYGGPSL